MSGQERFLSEYFAYDDKPISNARLLAACKHRHAGNRNAVIMRKALFIFCCKVDYELFTLVTANDIFTVNITLS